MYESISSFSSFAGQWVLFLAYLARTIDFFPLRAGCSRRSGRAKKEPQIGSFGAAGFLPSNTKYWRFLAPTVKLVACDLRQAPL
jgi:hypothetical protein